MRIESYAQQLEDVILYCVLHDVQHVFYIDVGASDPTVISVTKLFYLNGGCGINIEPLKSKCLLLHEQRPRDINLCIGIGEKRGKMMLTAAGTGSSFSDAVKERLPNTKEFEKGLELYSNGVLIMNKCADLLPDYFSFVQGLVDSPDLSLNISREMLQHDRQLQFIAKKIRDKIKSELLNLLKNDRTTYEEFFRQFGRTLKFGVYSDFGAYKDILKDLLLFYSSKEDKLVTLEEYVSKMAEGTTGSRVSE